MDGIEPWFQENGLDFQTATFGSYEDQALMSAGGTMIVVGTVNRTGAQRVGFLVEITYGRILEATFFEPDGIATWHRTDAREAKMLGVPLLEVMQKREREHRERYPRA